jgi:hypothetical protein
VIYRDKWNMLKELNMLSSIVFFLQAPSILILGSLVPVVGGVVLASMTEVSFNWLVVHFCTISKFPMSKD